MEKATLGGLVRAARKEADLSQRELAKYAGISFVTLQCIEAESRRTTPANLASVLDTLIALSTLFDGFTKREDAHALLEQYGGSAKYADAVLECLERYERMHEEVLDEINSIEELRDSLKADVDALDADDVEVAARILRALIETRRKK